MALICRTCLLEIEENETESIFGEKLVDSKYETISEMVSLCTGIEISSLDNFSDYICKQCIIEVLNAFEYRKKCWQSQKILLELRAQEYEFRSKTNDQENETTDINKSVSSIEVSLMPEIKTGLLYESYETYTSDLISLDITTTTTTNNTETEKFGVPKIHLDMVRYMKISEDDAIEGRSMICTLCSTAYKKIGHLRSHLGKVHKITSIAQFKCTACEKTFSSARILRMHIKTHNEVNAPVICQYCGKTFDQAMLLEIHLRRHRGEKSFICDQCDFRAFTSGELAMHKRSHSGEKPFKCYLCPAAYKTSSHRANHMRSHSDERPYTCNICSTSYKTRNTYRNHMSLHDPAKSMVCEICNRIYNSRRNLRVHMAHHGEKQFKCDKCDNAAFYLKSGLKYHMKIVHKIVDEFSIKELT